MKDFAEPDLSIAAFEAGDIDPQRFDHDAHVYAGWLYLQYFPLADAILKFTAALRRLTKRLGAEDKYNETVSWFFLLLIAERRAAGNADNWSAFRHDNDDLFCRDENIIARYYSEELIKSERARRSFVLPDRLAGPSSRT